MHAGQVFSKTCLSYCWCYNCHEQHLTKDSVIRPIRARPAVRDSQLIHACYLVERTSQNSMWEAVPLPAAIPLNDSYAVLAWDVMAEEASVSSR